MTVHTYIHTYPGEDWLINTEAMKKIFKEDKIRKVKIYNNHCENSLRQVYQWMQTTRWNLMKYRTISSLNKV